MATFTIPKKESDLTPELLQFFISEMHPGVSIPGLNSWMCVSSVNSSVHGRARQIAPAVTAPGSPPLPEQVLVKMVIDEPGVPAVLYETEVLIYQKFLNELDIEKPSAWRRPMTTKPAVSC